MYIVPITWSNLTKISIIILKFEITEIRALKLNEKYQNKFELF